MPTKKQLEARKLWVKALRSGEYKQCKYALCKTKKDSYCCMGVACEVYNDNHSRKLKKNVGPETASYAGEKKVLPMSVAKWLGVTQFGSTKDGGSLVDKNDCGTRFSTIADIIESGSLENFNG